MNIAPFETRDFFSDPFDSFEHFSNEISHFFKPVSRLTRRDVGYLKTI